MMGLGHTSYRSDLIGCTCIFEYKPYEFSPSWNSTPVVKSILRCFRHKVLSVAGSKSTGCLIAGLWFICRVQLNYFGLYPRC
jgi:hypothetical protein